MQIVINIPDDIYEDIVAHNGENREGAKSAYYFESLIKNDTSLPKGHGDLKDMDDIYEALEGWDDDTGWIIDAIDFQTETIVKADNEKVEG